MIRLVKSTFYREAATKKALLEFIANAQKLSFGEQCQAFESKFAAYQGRKHAIFVNSGSSANLALIQALVNLERLKKGDMVGFSAVTWATNVMPLMQLGLVPVPIDAELDTLNVSSAQIHNVLERYPLKAMFLTDLLGFCSDIEMLQTFCEEKGILLIEDTCESLGTVYQGKKLGNFGFASTFSFYLGHHMSTIEGGIIVTDDEELATMLSLVRAHGWDRQLSEKRQDQIRDQFAITPFYGQYTFYDLGYNFRPTEIQGFLGNQQMDFIEEIIRKRNENFLFFAKAIYQHDRYIPIRFDHIEFVSNFAIPLICRSKEDFEKLVRRCEGEIEIRPIVAGDITRQPFFKKYYAAGDFPHTPNARLIHNQGLYFGNNPELTKEEIEKLIYAFTS